MLDMSQTNLADALGITFQKVQKYEKGINRISASRLQQTANVLQVSVPFFFEGLPTGSDAPKSKTAASPAHYIEFLASSDGLSLAKAFTQIKRRNLRAAIVHLVEDLAGPDR